MRTVKYDRTAQSLHWLTAALVVAQFVIAWTMPDIHKDTKPVGLIAWHLAVGTSILLVVVIRSLWRATHTAPPPPATLPPALKAVSRATHFMLYGVLLVLPLLGWANASSRDWVVRLAGLVPLPSLAAPGSPVGHEMGDIHAYLAWVLLVLIGLHVAGALYHRLILRDGTLERMLP